MPGGVAHGRILNDKQPIWLINWGFQPITEVSLPGSRDMQNVLIKKTCFPHLSERERPGTEWELFMSGERWPGGRRRSLSH